MRLAIAAAVFSLIATAASAAECHRYTQDGRAPGDVIADIQDDRVLTISDKFDKPVVYDLVSAGTGISFMQGNPRSGGDPVSVLEHKGDLLVDLSIYTPYCEDAK